MAPRTEISDIRREELTLAALKCIAEKGYDRVTLDDVTKEAGLSKGIASYYFKNREELLVSVIQKMWDKIVDLTRMIWELPEEEDEKKIYKRVKEFYSNREIDLVSFMRGGLNYLAGWMDENPHIIRVILEFWCQVPRNPLITRQNDSMHNILMNISAIIIEEGMKRGVFKKRDPHMAAFVLISGISGLAFNHVINKSRVDTKKLEKDFGDLVLDYLCR